MQTSQTECNDLSLLFPFPEGWYFVASRQSILKETLIQKTWLGEQVVVWCDEEGRICMSESVCPHMGSELGPATGGRVRNGCLVCPFHGFEYDVTGQCVATPLCPGTQVRQAEGVRNTGAAWSRFCLVGERWTASSVESSRRSDHWA